MNKQKCELDFLLNILFCGKWQGCQSWHTPGTDRHWQHNMNRVWKWNRYISRIISNKLAQKPRESYSVFVADLQNSLKFLVIQLKQKQTKKTLQLQFAFLPLALCALDQKYQISPLLPWLFHTFLSSSALLVCQILHLGKFNLYWSCLQLKTTIPGLCPLCLTVSNPL